MELTEVVKRHYYLVYACENGNLINVEKKLINNSADINIANNNEDNNNNSTSLHYAYQNQNETIIKYLIENGVNVNVCNNNGDTQLFYICQNKNMHHNMKIIYYLINNDVDKMRNIKNNNNKSKKNSINNIIEEIKENVVEDENEENKDINKTKKGKNEF
ncbi:hypothetical protein U3516DRAFT_761066 [Neocallimastix sp. 'constans']